VAVTLIDYEISCYYLGICFLRGSGTSKNYSQAYFYLLEAANRGYENAYNLVAQCLELGRGVERNLQQSYFYYKKSANKGNEQGKKKCS